MRPPACARTSFSTDSVYSMPSTAFRGGAGHWGVDSGNTAAASARTYSTEGEARTQC